VNAGSDNQIYLTKRNMPIEMIDEMESSGEYEMSPICYARVEDYRN
jgi:hypothetical protein